MGEKAWAGRFSESQNVRFDAFNASIAFDYYLMASDILASKAHARYLATIGVLQADEVVLMMEGLEAVLYQIETEGVKPVPTDEDIHMWIERLLIEEIGILGKKLHTGRSRNDQVATAMKVWLRDTVKRHQQELVALIETLTDLAEIHAHTLMPGYTHGQHAQPITLGFHLLTYVNMLMRDHKKAKQVYETMQTSPLGAGALAGTSYVGSRLDVAKALGFEEVALHAMDAISDRDYVVDYLYFVSMCMQHLSRLSEELILWSSPHFGFVTLSDALTSGSSIMPQKKNPDACELIRGKAGVAIGRLSSMQSVLKGLPLSYNKDLQEDKSLVYQAYQDVSQSLQLMTMMLETAVFKKSVMAQAVQLGYLNATDLADYLVEKEVPFREAHHMCGALVGIAAEKGVGLEDLSLQTFQTISPLFDEKVYEVLDYTRCLNQKKSEGGTAPDSVLKMVKIAKAWLSSLS